MSDTEFRMGDKRTWILSGGNQVFLRDIELKMLVLPYVYFLDTFFLILYMRLSLQINLDIQTCFVYHTEYRIIVL